MSKSKRLVFFGNERLATGVTTNAPVLNGLMAAGYDIAAVVVNYSPPTSRQQRQLEVVEIAQQHNIPVINAKDLNQKTLAAFQASAGILAAFGQIVPPALIDAFPNGIINIHPSLLPKYRGPTPIESATLKGESQNGVSLMKLVAKMDAGPLYDQSTLALQGNETKQELCDKLSNLGAQLLLKQLPGILQDVIEPQPQDESLATYTPLISKSDGVVDWRKPAEQLEREVRAYAGWPKSHAEIFGKGVIITQARIAASENDGSLVLACLPGWLEIQQLIGPSGRMMNGSDFIRGYKI